MPASDRDPQILAGRIGPARINREQDRLIVQLGDGPTVEGPHSSMALTLIGEKSLRVAYCGAGMFCYLVTGYRRHAIVPWAEAFMPTTMEAGPVLLRWETLPWDEGITIVAGLGSLSGEQLLALVDCLYKAYKQHGPVDGAIPAGWELWRQSQQTGVGASVDGRGGANADALVVIITGRCQQQWDRDIAQEANRGM